MSSFVRKGGAPAAEAGTRPGLAGQTLISTGQADMDRLLGGGLPLGSLTLILEDGWSQHHLTLLKYFLAEGVACNQKTLLAASTEPEGGIASFLPKLLDPIAAEKEREAKKKEKEEDAVQLKIAWQYGRYLKPSSDTGGVGSVSTSSSGSSTTGSLLQSKGQQQQQNRPAGRDWCHSFDLSKSSNTIVSGTAADDDNNNDTSETTASTPEVKLVLCSGGGDTTINTTTSNGTANDAGTTGSREKLITSIASFITKPRLDTPPVASSSVSSSSSSVSRIAVLSLGDAAWNLGGGNGLGSNEARRSAIQSLIQIKSIVRDTKRCAIVTVPTAVFTESDTRRMAHIADVVLALEAVRDDSDIVRLAPDPSSVSGLLHLQKLASMGLIAAPAPQNPLYLVRSKRRRMAITPVEIDPDAEEAAAVAEGAAAAGAQGGGAGSGRTPASALLCGGPAKGKPDLEF